jgi:hypothetical protein
MLRLVLGEKCNGEDRSEVEWAGFKKKKIELVFI